MLSGSSGSGHSSGSPPETLVADLLIIGSGMAGLAAALFASNRGIKTVMAGSAGGFEYASGLLDLWGVTLPDVSQWDKSLGKSPATMTKKPWDMIDRLRTETPEHPFARLENVQLETAMNEFVAVLKENGLPYQGTPRLNQVVLTPMGTFHPTFRVPATMSTGWQAFKANAPCLILDFRGLREFSARFFTQVLLSKWPGLSETTIEFPDTGARSELFTPLLARSLETEQVQEKLIRTVRPLAESVECIGLPAVLGVQSSTQIASLLEDQLGVILFEIPTSPISVPGIRLKETAFKALESSSVIRLPNQRVSQILRMDENGIVCRTDSSTRPFEIHAKSVILATGRFLARGLVADRHRIDEPLFHLPVVQPDTRRQWHEHRYFEEKGHRINQAGLEVDDNFRPVAPDTGQGGQPVYSNLYAAGSILAHQDWVRTRSGAGLSIATAFAAIEHYWRKNKQ